LYAARVTDQATAAAVAALAPTGGGGDRFSNFLSKLPADADILGIWTSYLTHLATGPGGNAAAAVAQINLAGGGTEPFKELLKKRTNVGDNADNLKEIIALM